MHPRQAALLTLAQRVAAKSKNSQGGAVLWKYTDAEGNDFYLESKKTTVKSPFSGKSFSAKPTKYTPSGVAKDMKDEAKAEKGMEKEALLSLAQHLGRMAKMAQDAAKEQEQEEQEEEEQEEQE